MTPFHERLSPTTKRMAEDMLVRNLSPRTIDSYTYHVDKFLEHFGQTAEELGPAEIREYQLYLIKEKNVGRMKIHFQHQPSEQKGCRCSKVTLAIQSSSRPIYFTGILASEVRPGYVTLQIPSLESWEEPLRSLTRSQRECFEEPEFYEMLQREISTGLFKLPADP